MPYDASRGILETVWKDMGPSAQAAAARCATARAELKSVGMLTFEGSHLPEAQAAAQGVEVLYSHRNDVQLGLFTIPAIDGAITVGPKGESCTLLWPHTAL